MEHQILDDERPEEPINFSQIRFAGFWPRLAAALVDFLVMMPLLLINTYNTLNLKSTALMLLLTTLAMLYKPILEWQKSTTLGKMALGLKVVDESLNDINLEQAITRYYPWVINYAITMTINVWLFQQTEFLEVYDIFEMAPLFEEAPLSAVNTAYSFIFMGLVGSLVFDQRKQGFHDKHAGTLVIRAQ